MTLSLKKREPNLKKMRKLAGPLKEQGEKQRGVKQGIGAYGTG